MNKIAKFLGTKQGFWLVITLTILTGLLAFVATEMATYVLSVVAIIIPMFIMKLDHDRQITAGERDKAMHTKLDGIIAAVDKADDRLQGIEPDDPE